MGEPRFITLTHEITVKRDPDGDGYLACCNGRCFLGLTEDEAVARLASYYEEESSPSPPEPAPDVDAIIERLRERRTFINPGRPPLVPLDAAVAAVREATAPSPPDTDERQG